MCLKTSECLARTFDEAMFADDSKSLGNAHTTVMRLQKYLLSVKSIFEGDHVASGITFA